MPNRWISPMGLAAVWIAGLTGAGPAAAEIALDGTTGPAGALDGPAFEIPATLGRREGGNLFHSFATFSIFEGESATFSGPAGIDNVISRVTGGEASTIDGEFASTIPGADFFFLNPAGVIFGPNATLNVPGSFHVSTADELRFGDGEAFSATNPDAGSFTMSAPEAFGFLGADAGSIAVQGSFLTGAAGETLSLVGGDINLVEAGFITVGAEEPERGEVTLAAMSRAGSVAVEDGQPSAVPAGTLRIGFESGVDVSSETEGGGAIRMHAGELLVDGGFIVSNNGLNPADFEVGPDNGDGPTSGGIQITADRVVIANGGFVQSNAFGAGDAGNIVLRAGDLEVSNDSSVASGALGSGNAGNVSVLDARRVLVSGNLQSELRTEIASDAIDGTGNAGVIIVEADEVTVRDSGVIFSSTFSAGNAGSVSVAAGRISLETGGQIGSGTLPPSTGRGGSVTVTAGEAIVITGEGQLSPISGEPEPSGIFASTESRRPTAGPAGDATVSAPVIRLADRGEISSESLNPSPGGRVIVSFSDLLEIDDAEITTQADFANAGDIEVAGPGQINLRNGGEISTTVRDEGSAGNAGDIGVSSASIVLNAGIIQANGVQGQGGNIDVTARDTLIRTDDSVIEALSQLGIDGTVSIDAPAEDVLQSLDALPTDFLDVSSLLTEDCAARAARGGDRGGSLVGEGQGGVPPSPDAPLPGYYSDMTARASSAVQAPRLDFIVACAD